MTGEEHDRDSWVSGLIDAAARDYEPDTERLRDLVASRIAEYGDDRRAASRRLGRELRGGGRLRTRLSRTVPVGAGIAAVGAAVAIAVGITTMLAVTSPSTAASGAAVVRGGAGSRTTAITTSGAAAAPSTSPTTTPSAGGSPGSGAGLRPSASSGSYTATERVDQSSNAEWTQLDVVVTAKKPLTALVITISVADCAGLGMPKSYDDGPYGAFTTSTTTATDGSVDFAFTLTAGQTLAPGTVEFAAQFNHAATGWDRGADTYRISVQDAAAPDPAVTDGAY